MANTQTIYQKLKAHWGYESFRPGQADAITSVMKGRDVFVLFPTGGGKSLCYQIPAVSSEGVCLVISPLIALMQDQVAQMRSREIKADFIHAGMSYFEIDRVLDNAIYGDTKLLYMAPERLKHPLSLERIRQMNLSLIAIDEAHCISQWGHDFRPAYREIHEIRSQLPGVPFMALTATATSIVQEDIKQQLKLQEPFVVRKSFRRVNLHLLVRRLEDKLGQIEHMLRHVDGAAIVYVRSRKKTVDMAQLLNERGIRTAAYHAGMSYPDRQKIMDAWMKNKIRVVCATNAFGMGVDKSDVRIVIHVELPPSIEEYYQEAGRAGRDGEKAYCAILYNHGDEIAMDSKFKLSFPSLDEILHVYGCLGLHFNLAVGSGEGESFDFDFQSFVDKFNLGYQKTSNILKILEYSGWIALTESFYQPSKVMMVADKMLMYDYQLKHKSAAIFIKTLLRSYEGLYSQFTRISEKFMAKQLQSTEPVINQMLEQLQADEIIDYEKKSESAKLTFLLPRSTNENFNIDKKSFDQRKKIMKERLLSVKNYVEAETCRMNIMLNYFGELEDERCGYCDVCLQKNSNPDEETYIKFKAIILKNLDDDTSVNNLLTNFPSNRHNQVHKVLERMIREQWIARENDTIVLHPSKRQEG